MATMWNVLQVLIGNILIPIAGVFSIGVIIHGVIYIVKTPLPTDEDEDDETYEEVMCK